MTPPYCLYVEDDENDALLAAYEFQRATPLHMVIQSTGRQALDFLQTIERPPVFILVDLGLPLMSGVQLIYELRHNDFTARVPLFILTGREDDEQVLGALGADAYLVKPFKVPKLQMKLGMLGLSGLLIGNDP